MFGRASRKAVLSFLATTAFCGISIATFADYPLVSHRYLADPTGLEYNGRLYLYCSSDTDNDTNGGYAMRSITCISSDDLKNWTDHGEVLRAPRDVSWATYSWAPSAITNNGLIYLYFGNGAGGIGVATSSVPTGLFKDARGSVLINSSTPGAATANQWYFDPCIFIDGTQRYLYFGGADPTNARVILLNSNLTSVSGSASPMTAPNFFEASHLHKRGGIYYFSYSSRPSAGLKIQYATNSNPTSGFVFQGDVLANPPSNDYNNNHHSFFTFQGNWYVAYHNRYVAQQNSIPTTYKRNVCLDALNYNPDGTMQPVVFTTDGLPQLKYLNPYARVEAETMAAQSGIFTEPCVAGGMNVTAITNGTWTMARGVDFGGSGATSFVARIASAGAGGSIELRRDSLNGTLMGTCAVPATSGWQTWTNASVAVSSATARGVHDLYLKFTGAGAANLFNFDWWRFESGLDSSSSNSTVVKWEAESGAAGGEWAVSNSGSPAYITITTDSTAYNPGSAARVATYTVTFPTAGTYDLYARVRVGPGTYNDDSLFYGNGFGVKNPALDSDWIFINGLGSGGFTAPADIVTGGGTAGSGVWKWINLSQFTLGPIFAVTSGNLTQTFQIGAREDGLDLDAFAFGLNGVTYTVADLNAGADGTLPSGTATINWNDTRQQIDGFGAGVVFLDAGLSPMTDANADKLFKSDTTNQLGLSLLRVRVAPNSAWSSSVSAWNDSVIDAKKAAARGAGVLASPWTPPAAMKSNGALTNGSLLPAQYANYAAYLKKYADNMLSNGVSLRAISVQNEPDWGTTYESCVWTPTQLLNFFRANAAAIGSTPVMMPEALGFNFNYSDPTLNDPLAVTNVDLIGGHLYGVTTIQDYPNAHAKGKPTWMTEYLENDQTIESAIETAKQVHDCLITGNMSAYIWWKCLGDANGLLNAAGVIQKRGYVMSQFSRFVRPGHYRIGETNLGSGRVSAFKSPDGTQFAIIALNPYSLAFNQTIHLANFPGVSFTPWITSAAHSLAAQAPFVVSNATFAYNLPALSIVTFVGQANTAPQLTTTGPSSIDAGVTLVVSNAAIDPDLAFQTLTFSLLNAPAGAGLVPVNATNAQVIWRPPVSAAGTTNWIAVRVADSGSPSLSATNSLAVAVNPLSSQPWISSMVPVGGNQYGLEIAGPAGPDYLFWTSTNLLNWALLFTSNSPAPPFTLTLTNGNEPARFYQIEIGP